MAWRLIEVEDERPGDFTDREICAMSISLNLNRGRDGEQGPYTRSAWEKMQPAFDVANGR